MHFLFALGDFTLVMLFSEVIPFDSPYLRIDFNTERISLTLFGDKPSSVLILPFVSFDET